MAVQHLSRPREMRLNRAGLARATVRTSQSDIQSRDTFLPKTLIFRFSFPLPRVTIRRPSLRLFMRKDAVMPTVMVVDDVDVMRDVLARLLKREGYQTLTAGSGHEAIDVLEHSADPGHAPPDLILLDVKMPDIDGLDLLERLHADNRWKNVPVIMLTAV